MKILFLDIETQPDLVWTWGVYEENAIAVKQHWQCLSFSAKWRGGKHITKGLPDYAGYKPGGDDRKLMEDVWKLLDEADMVVAHNGAGFDIKKLNARFIAHGMTPPSPYALVDTKREVKNVAGFSSNKLDWLCQQLDLGRKLEKPGGWELWLKCMAGDKAAWKTMLEYNKHDVVLLEKLYELIAPWIRQPNAGLYTDEKMRCPNPMCGSMKLQRRGTARNRTRAYARFQCIACGAWCRSTTSETKRAVVGIDQGVR
jgi:hypothetical protein